MTQPSMYTVNIISSVILQNLSSNIYIYYVRFDKGTSIKHAVSFNSASI